MAFRIVIKGFLFYLLVEAVSANQNQQPRKDNYVYDGEIAPKLIVSEYIKAGKIQEARDRSLVTGLDPNITSYAGFLTVNEECGSNLFFWFFPSQNDWLNDPVSIWLNGGPGNSSLVGLFTENGPYGLTMDLKLYLREYSWNRNSSVIYIDQPVGVGYSYTEKGCYATTEEDVGRDLLAATQQFFLLFPELQKNDFFITGESYAGKYIPALAYTIHTSEDAKNINLKGFAIGNGWTDPINQMNYSAMVYQLGLVDSNRRMIMEREEDTVRALIEAGLYKDANYMKNYHLIGVFGIPSGYLNFYNYMYNMGEPIPDYWGYITSPEVREALHMGNATWHDDFGPHDYLEADIMQSVRPLLEELVEHYRVIIYNGQLDIICAYPLTVNYLQKMQWSGAEEYRTAQRTNWYVGDELAGYAKTVQKLTEVLVRNAGHMVPTDQPKWALDLYNKLIFNQPF